jgi:hypothetical protein
LLIFIFSLFCSVFSAPAQLCAGAYAQILKIDQKT